MASKVHLSPVTREQRGRKDPQTSRRSRELQSQFRRLKPCNSGEHPIAGQSELRRNAETGGKLT
jgi:hypothetical protein